MDRVLPLGKHTAEFETMTSPEGLLVKTVNMNYSGQRHFNAITDIDRETIKIHCNKIINKAIPLRKKNTKDQQEATLSDSVCICFETVVNKNVRSHFLHSVVLSFLSIIKFCTHGDTMFIFRVPVPWSQPSTISFDSNYLGVSQEIQQIFLLLYFYCIECIVDTRDLQIL